MIKTIIHCDKCDSIDVLHELKRQPVQEEHKTMQEVAERAKHANMVHALYYYSYWILLCKDCGHRVEYYT
jgi:hypothetical protein